MATTTAYLYVGLFVSRGVVLVLNITSAEMCASYADREKEDRERQRRRSAREATAGTTASLSSASNIRCTSRHQISRLPPAASVRAQWNARARVHFPLFTSEAKGCVSTCGSLFSKSPLRFRFFSLTPCSTLWGAGNIEV